MATDEVGARSAAPHGAARFAGAVYLVVVLTGVSSLSYAAGKIFAGETPAAIGQSVAANEHLLRAAIAAELVCYVAFLVLGLALYRLLARTDQFAAMLMAGLAISSVPFGYANVTHLLDVLAAVDGGAAASAEGAIATARAHYLNGLRVQAIPWGLWLIPFGYLVFRSGFLPRTLGILLVLGGLGYVANFLGWLLIEGYADTAAPGIFRAFRVGEMLICAWLLLMGARQPLWPRRKKA